jgi:putative NADH-flavin reductase
MKIALVGATGFVGSKILAEAIARGHTVTAIRRHSKKVLRHERVNPVYADIADTSALSRVFRGHAVVIHCYTPPAYPDAHAYVTAALKAGDHRLETIANYVPADPTAFAAHVKGRVQAQKVGTRSLIQAAKSAGIKRILAIGGAATLLVDGVPFLERPDFPKVFEGGARSTAVTKDLLREETGIDWTILCPPTMIVPGKRTGKFRLGLDDLLVAPDGSSSISLEDFAMAVINELENPQNTGRRFTVGY